MKEDDSPRRGRVRKKSAKVLEMEEFEDLEKKEVKKPKVKATPVKKRKGKTGFSSDEGLTGPLSSPLQDPIPDAMLTDENMESDIEEVPVPMEVSAPKVEPLKLSGLMAASEDKSALEMPPSTAELAAIKHASKTPKTSKKDAKSKKQKPEATIAAALLAAAVPSDTTDFSLPNEVLETNAGMSLTPEEAAAPLLESELGSGPDEPPIMEHEEEVVPSTMEDVMESTDVKEEVVESMMPEVMGHTEEVVETDTLTMMASPAKLPMPTKMKKKSKVKKEKGSTSPDAKSKTTDGELKKKKRKKKKKDKIQEAERSSVSGAGDSFLGSPELLATLQGAPPPASAHEDDSGSLTIDMSLTGTKKSPKSAKPTTPKKKRVKKLKQSPFKDGDASDSSLPLSPKQQPMYSNTDAMAMRYMTSAERMKVKRKRKEKDPGKPKRKRAPTAYTMWCSSYRPKLMKDNRDMDFAAISKRLGEVWHGLPEKHKMNWKRKAKKQATKLISTGSSTMLKSTLKRGLGTPPPPLLLTKSGPGSIGPAAVSKPVLIQSAMDELNTATFKVTGCNPLDMAAHLKLLGESLSIIGSRLQEHQGPIAVQGSLSVLLDSLVCALGPLTCLTTQVNNLNGCPIQTHTQTMDNIAYIMPGIG